MRTTFNRPQLRRTALTLLVVAATFIVIGAGLIARRLAYDVARGVGVLSIDTLTAGMARDALAAGACLASLPFLAAGVAFWMLSRDRQAGIVIDNKGLLLNLGQSSAFVAWSNIERVGVTWRNPSVLAFGSRWQLGIALRDVSPYIQSYEERLPAAPGPLQRGLQFVRHSLRGGRPPADDELALCLTCCRRRTGYDIVIPEALLGCTAPEFAALIEERWRKRQRRLEPAAATTI